MELLQTGHKGLAGGSAGAGLGGVFAVDHVAAFAAWQTHRNLSPETISSYRAVILGLAGVLNGQGLLNATREDVEEFLAGRKITERGRYHYLSHLSCFFRWAIDEGFTTTDPTRRIPRPKLPQNLPRPISDRDLEMALRMAGKRMRAWLALAAYAGLRCKEIANLKAEDFRFDYDLPVLIVSAPKGKRQRAVPVHLTIEDAVRSYGLPRDGYLFTRWDSPTPVGAYTVSHAVAKHLRELGIQATAHQLRHYFATHVYRLSKDLRLTQDLMGHADPSSTAIYTQLAPTEAAAVVQQL